MLDILSATVLSLSLLLTSLNGIRVSGRYTLHRKHSPNSSSDLIILALLLAGCGIVLCAVEIYWTINRRAYEDRLDVPVRRSYKARSSTAVMSAIIGTHISLISVVDGLLLLRISQLRAKGTPPKIAVGVALIPVLSVGLVIWEALVDMSRMAKTKPQAMVLSFAWIPVVGLFASTRLATYKHIEQLQERLSPELNSTKPVNSILRKPLTVLAKTSTYEKILLGLVFVLAVVSFGLKVGFMIEAYWRVGNLVCLGLVLVSLFTMSHLMAANTRIEGYQLHDKSHVRVSLHE
jgi:sorbitol-specific phosphotransferase system component IIC